MSAIENGNRQEIEDAKVHANEGHEGDDGEGSHRDGFTGGARDADNALQFLDRDAATEKFAEDTESFGDDIAGLQSGGLDGFDWLNGSIGQVHFWRDTNLIVLLRRIGGALLGRDGEGKKLALALHFKL